MSIVIIVLSFLVITFDVFFLFYWRRNKLTEISQKILPIVKRFEKTNEIVLGIRNDLFKLQNKVSQEKDSEFVIMFLVILLEEVFSYNEKLYDKFEVEYLNSFRKRRLWHIGDISYLSKIDRDVLGVYVYLFNFRQILSSFEYVSKFQKRRYHRNSLEEVFRIILSCTSIDYPFEFGIAKNKFKVQTSAYKYFPNIRRVEFSKPS